jgi:hypothetical protein
MALPTLPGEEKREDTLNPGQQDSDRRFNDIAKAEEQGTFNDIANNYNQTADSSQEDAAVNRLKERESEGDSSASVGWKYNAGNNSAKPEKFKRLKQVFKISRKRGGIVGILALLGVGGGLLAGFLGPASMLINLAENATLKNDTTSTSMERRFMKVLGFSTADSDPICANNTKNIKCKMGKISNRALDQLAKKGITPEFDNEKDSNDRKKTGYPTKNPSRYVVDLKDGSPISTVDARDLPRLLANNPKIAKKVLGTGGAFNVRVKAWSGKHITEKLYTKFGINRNGGLADGENKRLSPVEKLAEITEKLREKMPGSEKISSASADVRTKITNQLGKAGKAGPAYVGSVASCIAVKTPSYIASAVAAVQLAQIMPVGMETILSPGNKAKSSGVDTNNSISGEDVDSIGTLLTNKTPRESDGKMTSALDSPILQASIGVNTAKSAVSKDYTPGFSVLTNPIVKTANAADANMAPFCNVVMSPAAMYTALAISSTLTVAASSTVFGGFLKLAADYLISEMITRVAVNVAEGVAKDVLVDVAKNDKIEKAQGEALGDVAGISMASMFSAGGMARNLPVLKQSQVADFDVARTENEAFERDMDVATLSPFDISSKYTFLGSIVNNTQLAVLQSGKYDGSLLSTIPGLVNFSKASLVPSLHAADNSSANYCGYADDFGLTTENAADTPAINMAGLPCTGLTQTQMNMSTNEAIDLMVGEQWLDESKTIKDTDSIQDLMGGPEQKGGYIKANTPLADYITSCSDASTGEYLYNSSGCTVSEAGSTTGTDLPPLNNPKSLEAMAVFLLDYQQIQMINGDDEGGSAAPAVADTTVDEANLFNDSTAVACAAGTTDAGKDTGYNKGTAVPLQMCALPNAKKVGQPAIVNSRASGVAFAMFEQMKTDLGLEYVTLNDAFRTMADQQSLFARYGSPQAARPGMSNHQMGFALDINMGSLNGGNSGSYRVNVNSSYPGNKVYEWLVANASKYHFSQLKSEGWHWSINGG